MSKQVRLWLLLLVMLAASPLGWLVPQRLGSGTAWGEWSVVELRRLVGWVPAEMARLGDGYRAPLPGYTRPGRPKGSPAVYLAAGAAGTAATLVAVYAVGLRLAGGKRDDP